MTSSAQLAANRLNAQKSTGPNTPGGKARVARNALKHGVTAADLVLFDEIEAEFEQFRTGLVLDFGPSGAAESALVDRIAILAWRLRRAGRAEAALVNAEAERRKESAALQTPKGGLRIDLSMIFDRFTHKMSALTRYEATIERQFNRAMATLERRQAKRRERETLGEREEQENGDRAAEAGHRRPVSADRRIALSAKN